MTGTSYVVTGASRGLGREVALALLRRGERVVGVSRQPPRGEDFEPPSSGRFDHIRLDLRGLDSERAAVLLEKVPIEDSVVFILNAARNGVDRRDGELDLEDFVSFLRVNVVNQLALIALIQRVARPSSIRVVMVASYAAFKRPSLNLGYALSKLVLFDLAALTGPEPFGNVKFQAIVFGAIDTDMLRANPELRTTRSGARLRARITLTPEAAAQHVIRLVDSDKTLRFAPGLAAAVVMLGKWLREASLLLRAIGP